MSEPNEMEHERKIELLAYAKVCFSNGTNPFAPVHLQKKNVNSEECGWLSQFIADLLDDELIQEGVLEAQEIVQKAEIEYEETQQ